MTMRFPTLSLAIFACAATSVWAGPVWAGPLAGGGATVDEPAALALLALGVVGLVIGRQVAKRRD